MGRAAAAVPDPEKDWDTDGLVGRAAIYRTDVARRKNGRNGAIGMGWECGLSD